MEEKLLLIPWMIAVIYSSIPLFWFAIHPFAARWRRMQRSPYRALLPLWALLILALALISSPWHDRRLYSAPWMWFAAVPFFAFGFRVYARIFSDFGAHKLSGEAELRPDEHQQQLVTTGLHQSMRHPIYFAHLCNLAGWAVGTGIVVIYVLLAIDLCITYPVMIYMEERELAARFGEPYRKYQSKVPLMPWPGMKGRIDEQTATR
jgi:protein-S-isoprenylcysteine O-methyltransferase Ste14